MKVVGWFALLYSSAVIVAGSFLPASSYDNPQEAQAILGARVAALQARPYYPATGTHVYRGGPTPRRVLLKRSRFRCYTTPGGWLECQGLPTVIQTERARP